jgi:hypothetical protein
MLANDFPEFEALMRRFEKIFGKSIDDETMQLYFGSLREVPLNIVRKKAEEYLKRAKFFPKPADLRPKDEAPVRDVAMDSAFGEGVARCVANLEELRRTDPEKWSTEVRLRKLDRIVAIEQPHTPIYARALCEWREARGIHVGDKEWAEVGGR